MQFPVRLLLSAALLAALAPMTVAVAQDATAPVGPFDADADFGRLRGSDGQEAVDLFNTTLTNQPLPTETPEAGRAQRGERLAPTIAQEDEAPLRPRARTADARDASAYDPLGIRVGSFVVLPSIEMRGGYTTNAAGSSTGGPSAVWTLVPDLTVRSDWSRHELGFVLHGTYDYFSDTSVAPLPTVNAGANARIDLPRDWALRLRGNYNYQTQSISSLDYPTGVEKPPGINTYVGGATLDGSVGRTVLQLRGNVAYSQYNDGHVGDIVVPQGDRDNTLVSGAARVGYEVTPAFTPFVEAELSDRSFKQKIDNNGFNRASQGVTLRGGIAYSAAPVLTGEVALGWHHERYDDAVFKPFDAMTVDASVIWSPTPLTNFTLRAATFVNPTTDPNSAGSIVYDAGIRAEHALRRNLTLEGDLGWRREYYEGINVADVTYQAGFGVTWKLNREAWVVGRFSQEYYHSAVPGGSYPTTTVSVGLRLQR
ncbi:outer membrane beta-barrel protein [Kaistia sp. 32K]|uniref:outer membrane beta-barrel protein n=1 Tax=Kaistia sp. 32K TaxID=2795690 RepID=UPI0019157DC1|nr:outer membrane beta-barrel protein [Kaistia sp. 32K]